MKKYKHVILGGTFDRLHDGHKALINKAFEIGETVWLGVTSDKFVKTHPIKQDKFTYWIEPYFQRKNTVEKYLRLKKWKSRSLLVELYDRYGTTLVDERLEAIVVSPETEPIAKDINKLRNKEGLSKLDIIRVDWIKAQDKKPIQSQRIRAGVVGREGTVYRISSTWRTRLLPQNLRLTLKQPLGKLIRGSGRLSTDITRKFLSNFALKERQKYPLLISVGDVATRELLLYNVHPNVSIVDLRVQRKQVYKKVTDHAFRDIKLINRVQNMSGTLTYSAYKALEKLLKTEAKPNVLQIDGEEDLLTLFAIILSPLNSLIVYGQPHEGLVGVVVTEAKKKEVWGYIQKFKRLA